MSAARQALAEVALGTAVVAAAWTAGASSAFLAVTGLWGHPLVPATDYLWGWWRYLPHAGRNPTVTLGLVLSAGAVAVPLLSLATLVARGRWRRLGGLRGVGQRLGQIRRASSNNHGQADWMTEARISRLFPPVPHPEIGGVVVGERSRDDLTPQHALTFDPRDPGTWGSQGRGPLMFDHCERGTTHSLIIGGGGTYKSTTLTPPCCTGDPAQSSSTPPASSTPSSARRSPRPARPCSGSISAPPGRMCSTPSTSPPPRAGSWRTAGCAASPAG